MRLLKALVIYIAWVFVAGGLLAPVLHRLVAWAAGAGLPLGRIPDAPFYLYVSRAMLLVAVLGLVPLARVARIASWGEIGFAPASDALADLRRGAWIGLVSLSCVAAAILLAGVRVFDPSRTAVAIAKHLLNASLAALVVSLIEETLFRGVMLGVLQRGMPRIGALAFSSAFYAIVHFFQRPPNPVAMEWYSGLLAVRDMTRGFLDVAALVPGFLNLTLAGVILGYAFLRTRTIWLAVGLHAAWIFWVKSFGFFTTDAAQASPGFWGTRRLTDGWAAFVVLLALLAWLVWRSQRGDFRARVAAAAAGRG
jgi:membrane protease YdiL (CAAX protease family)